MEEKKLKTLNFKIDENLLKKTNYYRKVEPNGALSQLDYVTKALEEKNENTRTLRSGGMILRVPNPDRFNYHGGQQEEILTALSECVEKLRKIHPGLSFGIDEILIYAKYHFYEMTKKERENLENNFYKDLEIENK